MSEVQEPEQLIKQLQTELETRNQALYDCERRKKIAEALVLECQEEIRILQNDKTSEDAKLKAKIQQLEESNLSLKESYNENISYLEKELSKKDQEISDLKRELEDVIKISGKQQSPEIDGVLEENASLKEQISDLCLEVEDLTKICETKEDEITSLHELNTQLKEELENYKEILSCKKDELAEANVINQTLQDKYTCLKAEFDSLKTKPLDDQSRGNSLFAEVDDRRVQLQQNMNQMKTQYLEMKRERANHLKQIAALRNENATLLERLESEVNEREDDEEMMLLSYKNQVRTLTELIESYKNELKKDAKKDDDGSIRFFDKMINAKNQEIEALKEKLSRNSFNEITLSQDLAIARKEIRKYKLEIQKLQNDIGQMKVEIKELKSPTLIETPLVQEQPEVKPIVKNEIKADEEIVNETNKENDAAVDKKVQFTANTTEPKVTDRSRYRRGVRVLQLKPVHISSIPKQ